MRGDAVFYFILCVRHTQTEAAPCLVFTEEKGDPDLFLIILFYSHVGSQGSSLIHYFVQPWAQHLTSFHERQLSGMKDKARQTWVSPLKRCIILEKDTEFIGAGFFILMWA